MLVGKYVSVCVGKRRTEMSCELRGQKQLPLMFPFSPSVPAWLVIVHSDFDPELCLLSRLSLQARLSPL